MYRKIIKESVLCLISTVIAAGLVWLIMNRVSSDLIIMAFLGLLSVVILIRYCCCGYLHSPTVERRVSSYEPVVVQMPPITTTTGNPLNPVAQSHYQVVRVQPPPYIVLQNPGYIYNIGFLDRRFV